MIEIRIHGRGGQGAVVASKILADAVFIEGHIPQAFPNFGVERRGAPVCAFVRIDEKPICLRSEIYEPDHLVILDQTLINNKSVFAGLKKGGKILLNSPLPPQKFADRFSDFKIATVDANKIALENKLGSPSAPIVNTAILGAVAKFIRVCDIESILKAIEANVPNYIERNIQAAKIAYEKVKFGD